MKSVFLFGLTPIVHVKVYLTTGGADKSGFMEEKQCDAVIERLQSSQI